MKRKNKKGCVLPDFQDIPEPPEPSEESVHRYNLKIDKKLCKDNPMSLGDCFLRDMKFYLDDEEKHYKRQIAKYEALDQQHESEKELMKTAIGKGDIKDVRKVCNKIWGTDF